MRGLFRQYFDLDQSHASIGTCRQLQLDWAEEESCVFRSRTTTTFGALPVAVDVPKRSMALEVRCLPND